MNLKLINSKELARDIKFAFDAAKNKMSGQGQFIAISVGLVLLSFLVMAIIAPLAYQTTGWFQTFLSLLPMAALVFALYFAFKGFWKIIGKGQALKEPQSKGAIASDAIKIALNEAKEAAIINNGDEYEDCLSGRVNGRAIAIIKTKGLCFALIRHKFERATFLMGLKRGSLWPLQLKQEAKLAPVSPPQNIDMEIWCHNNLNARDKAQEIMEILNPVLQMSNSGGELPILFMNEKSLILGFERADMGAVALLGNEACKLIAQASKAIMS